MKPYETIVILRPDVTDEYVSTLTKKVEKAIVAKPGELQKKDDWGIKRLAYEIKKQKQGRYLYWSYLGTPKNLNEVDKRLRFEENVLRFLTVFNIAKLESQKQEKKILAKSKTREVKKPEFSEPQKEMMRGKGRGERLMDVDFKDPVFLSQYITDRGKIVPRRVTGIDAVSQRAVARAIKRARQLALLSYTEGFHVPAPEVRDEP